MFGTSVNVIAPKNAINQCLCKMSSINRWSRHKPVSWPHLFRNAIQTTHPTDYEQWWMGKDGDYNINYDWTEIQGTGANPSDIFAQRARFTLKNIDGNDGDVARLSDYEDYVHYPARFYSGGAVAPVSIAGMDFNGKIDPPANQASAYATFQIPTCATNDSEGKSLLLTYMDVLGMYYIGFCL